MPTPPLSIVDLLEFIRELADRLEWHGRIEAILSVDDNDGVPELGSVTWEADDLTFYGPRLHPVVR